MLTQEEANRLFEYRDGELFNKVQRHRAKVGDKVGCATQKGYSRFRANGKLYLLHRVIYLMHHGYMPEFVDHINGNPQDNRIVNLRASAPSSNAWNSVSKSTNTSGAKGVSWYKRYGMWRGQVVANGTTYHVGYFKDLSEAEKAVQEAREKYHGEFARHKKENNNV